MATVDRNDPRREVPRRAQLRPLARPLREVRAPAPGGGIEPYELSLTDASRAECNSWAARVLGQLEREPGFDLSPLHVRDAGWRRVPLSGLVSRIEGRRGRVERLLQGLGLGKRRPLREVRLPVRVELLQEREPRPAPNGGHLQRFVAARTRDGTGETAARRERVIRSR